MPDKDTKKNQQGDTTPASDVSAQGATNNTTVAVSGETSAAMKTLDETSGNTLKTLGNNVNTLVGEQTKAKQNDKIAQRRERSMQMISGISDGLASLANLIGVGGYGASNIDLSGAMTNPKLQEKFEQARKERKADIKDIDDRLEQKRRELLEMQQRFGLAKVELQSKEQAEANAERRHKEELDFRKERAKVSDNQWQQTFDANQGNAAADRDLRKTQITNDYNLRLRQLNQSAEQAGLKGSFPVLIGENEMLDIPKKEINNATIGRIFEQLPKEFKDLAQGKPQYKYEDDGFGNSIKTFAGYAPATLEEKLAAIGAAARTDKTIQDELRKLAGTYKPEQRDEETQVSEIDDSHLNGLGTMSMNPYFGQSKTSKVNWNQFE